MKKHKKYQGVMPPYSTREKSFRIIDSAVVDGRMWYTVQTRPPVSEWVRQQPNNQWYSHVGASGYKVIDAFDIEERLYNMLALRWS